MKNYCPACCHIQDEEMKRCPRCRTKLREPNDKDAAHVKTLGAPWAGMFEEILRDNAIPFYTTDDEVGGLGAILGYAYEVHAFFVPYAMREQAMGLADELFSGAENEEGWIDENEDGEAESEDNEDSE